MKTANSLFTLVALTSGLLGAQAGAGCSAKETGGGVGECKHDSDCADDMICEDHECVESDWGGAQQGATTGSGSGSGGATSSSGSMTGATTGSMSGSTVSTGATTGSTSSVSTGIASSSSGGTGCDNTGDCNMCGDCAQQGNCADELNDCGNNPECAAIITCLNACAPADMACPQACLDAHPNGMTQIQLLFTCIFVDECPNDCAM